MGKYKMVNIINLENIVQISLVIKANGKMDYHMDKVNKLYSYQINKRINCIYNIMECLLMVKSNQVILYTKWWINRNNYIDIKDNSKTMIITHKAKYTQTIII